MNKFHQIIKNVCDKHHITMTILSEDWLVLLEKENKSKYIFGYKFDSNGHGIGNVLDDKYALYDVLKYKKCPTIEHKMFYKNYDKNEVKEYFEKYNNDIVVKSNTGTCGNEVFRSKNIHELYEYMDKLFVKNFSISLCPYYNILNEYRVIVLDDEAMLIYGKKKPIIVGDGQKKIHQLLQEFNPIYFTDEKLSKIEDRVLKENEIYEYNWMFNLYQGATIFEVSDKKFSERICKLALTITKNINASFCSVDLIETTDQQLLAMEINSGIMMNQFIDMHKNGEKIAYKIYEKAILSMFEN